MIRRVLWAANARNKTLKERLRIAELGRFRHMTLFPADVRAWEASGLSLADMRRMMIDAGVSLVAIDPYGQWVPDFAFPNGYPELPRSHFEFTEAQIFRMAETLEAEEINLVEPFREPFRRTYETAALRDAFASFAERAQARGFVTTLEFMPLSDIADLSRAWDIVRDAPSSTSGICFDTWHFVRGKSSLDVLRTIPGERIIEIQISDAKHELVGPLLNDLLRHRRMPGEGEFPLLDIVAVLKQIGAYRSVGPEVFSDVVEAMDVETVGPALGAAMDRWS